MPGTATKPKSDDKKPTGFNPAAAAQKPKPAAKPAELSVPIAVPLGPKGFHVHDGYAATTVELRLTPRQAAAAKMAAALLSESGARAQGGRRVSHPEGGTVEDNKDALRWLLDCVADAIESQSGTRLMEDYDLIF